MQADGRLGTSKPSSSSLPQPSQPSWAGAGGSAALVLMVAFVGSRVSGLFRDVVISARFGASPEYEAYLAGNRIPDLLFQVLAGGAVASAFIPVLAGYLERRDAEGEWRLLATLLNLSVVALVPIIAVLMLLANPVMSLLTPGWSPTQQGLAADLSRVMLVSPLFFTLGCFVTSVLNAHRQFLLPALGPIMYNLGIIGGALWLTDVAAGWGLSRGYGLAAGAAIGALGFLVIQAPGLSLIGVRYRPVLDLGMASVRQVGRLLVPRTMGLGVAQINYLVVLFFASMVPGGYAALNYAWLLTMLPLGIFAMAISTAAFPTLARQTAAGDMSQMRHTLVASLRAILFLTIPASVGLVALAGPIVRLIFERGAFDAAATEATAVALRFYAAALFAHSATEILARSFYALHDTRTPFFVSTASMLLNLTLCATLVGPMGHGGLALAVSIAGVAEAVALAFLLHRVPAWRWPWRWNEGAAPGFARDIPALMAQSGTAAIVMGGFLIVVAKVVVEPIGFWQNTIYMGITIAAGAATYWGVAATLGCAEARQLGSVIRRRMIGAE
jgi:putative peptidoglycan lipid II flippase